MIGYSVILYDKDARVIMTVEVVGFEAAKRSAIPLLEHAQASKVEVLSRVTFMPIWQARLEATNQTTA